MTKLLWLLLVLLVSAPAGAWAAIIASDGFNRVNSANLGSNWTTIAGLTDLDIASGRVFPNQVGGTTGRSLYTGIAFGADQASSMRVITLNTANTRAVGLIVSGTTAGLTMYECQFAGPLGATATATIYEWVAGTPTSLATTGAALTLAAGDRVKCQRQGDTIKAFVNGVEILTNTDASPRAAGIPGIFVHTTAGSVTDAEADDWIGEDFTAPASTGSAAVDSWYADSSCTYNGDGLSQTCAASAGAAGAFNSLININWTPTTGVDDGDTLYICGKHRNELGPDTLAGTSALPITISGACPGNAGTISGADIETSWTGPDANGNYVSGSTYQTPLWVLVDGVVAYHGAALASLATGEWFFSGNNVYYHGDPTGKVIEVAVRGWGFDGVTRPQSFLRITGLRFEAQRNMNSRATIMFKNCMGILVDTNVIYAARKGMEVGGTCNTVRGTANTISYTTDGLDMIENTTKPFMVRYDNNTVRGNWIGGTANFTVNAETTHSLTLDNECIASTNAGSYYAIEFNTLYDCGDAISLLYSVDVTGISIRGNIIYDVADDAIQTRCTAGCVTQGVITGNLIYRGGYITGGTASYAIITEGAAVGAAPGSHVDVTYNTIYGYSNGLGINPFDGTLGYSYGNIIGNVIVNLKTGSTGCGTACYFAADNWQNMTAGGAKINNNLYYSTGASGFDPIKFDMPGIAIRSTLTAHQADMTPNESASLNSDPLFVTNGSDFRLGATSPARRTGSSTVACIGVGGRACYPDSPDMGAWPTGSGSPAAPRSVRVQ